MADDTSAAAGEESEQQLTFTVKSSAESKYTLTLPVSTTIADLKQQLSSEDHANLPPDRQRLIYSGRVLKDHDTLASCKIKDGNTVHLVKGAASNSRQNPATSTSATTSTGTTAQNASANPAQPTPSTVPSNIAAGTGAANPLAQLTGARYAGFHNLPGLDAFGADGGMGAPPNADAMLRLLEDPNFASQMNEAMSNPAVLDMLRNNPMIRNNPIARQAIENPEFRRVMMSPEMIRMQMQMQRAMEGAGGGLGGAGAGGAAGGFPMPGQTDTTETPREAEGAGADAAAAAGTGQTPSSPATNPAAANPFAALFPGAGATPQGGAGAGATPNQNQSNPLAAMSQQLMQNPDLMRSMMQMMGSGGGSDTTGTGAGTGTGNADANPFGAFNPFMFGDFGGLGAGAGQGAGTGAAAAPPDNRPPEERYEEQLRQLNDMGFYEFDRNVMALRRSGGSVQGAVEWLLSNP